VTFAGAGTYWRTARSLQCATPSGPISFGNGDVPLPCALYSDGFQGRGQCDDAALVHELASTRPGPCEFSN